MYSFLEPQFGENIEPKSDCIGTYNVTIYILNATKQIPFIRDIKIRTLRCVPTKKNRYCSERSQTYKYFKEYQPCHLYGDEVSCPIYNADHFKSFSDYANWNSKKVKYRIHGFYQCGKKKHHVLLTDLIQVRPVHTCKNAGKIPKEFLKTVSTLGVQE